MSCLEGFKGNRGGRETAGMREELKPGRRGKGRKER